MTSIHVVTLSDRELDAHLESATGKLTSFAFRPPEARPSAAEPETTASLRGRPVAYRPLQASGGKGELAEREFRLADRIREIRPSDDLYTDVEHGVLRTLRRAIQVFLQIHDYYEKASGLDRLKAANQAGQLPARDEAELAEKIETACAAGVFAFAGYVTARLLDTEAEATERLAFEVEAPGELPLDGKLAALHAALYQVWRAIDAHARDDATLVKAVRDASRGLAQRIQTLQHSLAYADFFTRYHYRVEPEGVLVAGFELPEGRVAAEIQVPARRPEEVVGNHVAKLEACRLAQRLSCYDLERKQNPFVELGGFVFTFIADGSPGTGKTTLIQMIVTLLRDHTRVAGLGLRYENFSVDQISDYQGRSGHNARRFCDAILDPRGIGFGTIDDVDQVCGQRGDRNASAGQLEATAVFMQQLGGAQTVVRGNASFGLFSNYPERVDGALRQRAQARFLVDGPRTREDYTDLLHILLHRNWELPLGDGYEPRATQRLREVIAEKYGAHDAPRSEALRRIFDEVCAASGRGGRLSSWRAFGEYLHALAQHDPRFTGRAVRNISDAVRARMMDFDLPAEWLEKREPFFAQPYQRKLAMLEELRGEVTPEIVVQEINRYADSEARYTDAADERALEERTRQIAIEARARKAAAERGI